MDFPWLDDVTALQAALRSGEVSPLEIATATLAAIESSSLNAVCHLDAERALAEAATADVSLPLGGVPIGIKELDPVAGWPANEASLALAGEFAATDSPLTERLRAAGAILIAQTTASEFGGVNFTSTRLHGTTTNPWNTDATPGGSSGGSAAAVAGGLLPLATGGDGGGSIRIPAGFCGLVGLKNTYGRIPKSTSSAFEPLTAVLGSLTRSVADTARFLDVGAGADERDPFSLPKSQNYEATLGSVDLRGLRVGVVVDLGAAVVADDVAGQIEQVAAELIAACGMKRVHLDLRLPRGGFEWSMVGSAAVLADLGDRYPACADDLGFEMAFATKATTEHFGLTTFAAVEQFRRASVTEMAHAFDQVDLIMCATNPDVAFEAAGPMRTVVGGRDLIKELGFGEALGNNGALTIPANTTGNPALALPAGTVRGMPVSLQVIGRHHAEEILLGVGLTLERTRPWPLVAPGAPK